MSPVRLTTLDPRWIACGGEGISSPTGQPCPDCPAGAPRPECRTCLGRGLEYQPAPRRDRIGVSFNCPCAACATGRASDPDHPYWYRVYVYFANPVDGDPAFEPERPPHWTREGDDFETLRLMPSILSDPSKGGCGWHGYVGQPVPGEVKTC